jgi:hypothetical protein
MTSAIHEHFIQIGPSVGFDPATREYYIVSNDDGEVLIRQTIEYCPICGEKFPRSLRSEWFDRLEEKDIDPLNDEVPAEFKTDEWWKNEGL